MQCKKKKKQSGKRKAEDELPEQPSHKIPKIDSEVDSYESTVEFPGEEETSIEYLGEKEIPYALEDIIPKTPEKRSEEYEPTYELTGKYYSQEETPYDLEKALAEISSEESFEEDEPTAEYQEKEPSYDREEALDDITSEESSEEYESTYELTAKYHEPEEINE